MVYGILIFVHSQYLHRNVKKLRKTKTLNDLASIALALEAMFFLIIIKIPTAGVITKSVLQDLFANAICGAIVQGCDNFSTFSRYDVVVGGTSKAHQYLALIYVIVLLYFSWWPFFTFLPLGWDMNSPFWMELQFAIGGWFNFVVYVIYDCFYSGAVIVEIIKHIRSKNAVKNMELQIFAYKALGRSLFSIAGILCYSFFQPVGILEQSILIVTGIHFFLNWKDSHKFFCFVSWKGCFRKSPTAPSCGYLFFLILNGCCWFKPWFDRFVPESATVPENSIFASAVESGSVSNPVLEVSGTMNESELVQVVAAEHVAN